MHKSDDPRRPDDESFHSSFVIRHSSLLALAFFSSVAAARLLAALHAERIAGTTDDLLTHTRQIANTTAAHEHDAMFLKRVAFARNINRHFLAVGKPHTGNFPQCGIRLLGSHRPNEQTNATLLRALIQHGRFTELSLRSALASDELVNRRHRAAFYRGSCNQDVSARELGAKRVETSKFTCLPGAVKGGARLFPSGYGCFRTRTIPGEITVKAPIKSPLSVSG
jgi:hypothetical protein